MKNRIYLKSGSENRETFAKLPGVEMEECCRCRHGELASAHSRISKEHGIITHVCSRCGCAEMYLYKEKQ
jgi:hypothetical protein